MGKSSKKRRRAGQSASALEALEASPTGVESDVSASSPTRGAPSSPPIKPRSPASAAPTPPSQQKYTNDPDDPSTWSKSKKKRMKQKRKKEAIAAANARKRLAAAEEEGELERKAAKFAAQSGPVKLQLGGASGDVVSPSKPSTPNNGEGKGSNKRPPAADENVASSPKKKKKKSDKRTAGAEEATASPAEMSAQKADGTPKKKKQKHREASPERSGQSTPKPKKQKLDDPDGIKKQHDNSQTKADGNGAQDHSSKPNLSEVSESIGEPTGSEKPVASEGETSPKKKKRKKKKSTPEKGNGTKLPPQSKQDDATADERNNNGPSDSTNPALTPAPSPRKITLPRQSRMSSLQKAFLERLTSSRFRELNEELYTQPSSNSFEHFTDNPELFEQYHVGFRRQAAEWPVNPVDVIFKKIVRDCSNGRKSNDSGGGGKRVIVADFGCGDAKLAERLLALRVGKDGHTLEQAATKKKKKGQSNEQRQCPFEVHSFDLVSGGNKLVTAADMANVPLEDESVDVAVYCLALMGTNVADFVREAWRVLRVGGVLRVAEVRSRFETAAPEGGANVKGGGKRGKLSNGKKHRAKQHHSPRSSGSGNGDEDGAPKPLMLLDEFHSLMKRCGFECTDMDQSNKMFLFMDFAKAKGGPGVSETESFTAKPCIYKRR
ncbi:hypothetical protein ACHAXT_007361 [Thalassiosira profunda]